MKFDSVFLKFSEVCSGSDRDKWECQISTVLTIIVFTFLLLFGTFGNITSLCVLLRKKMRKLSASTFLTFLTVSDTFNIWLSSAQVLSQHFYDKNVNQISMMSCKTLPWLHFNLASFSLWSIAAFSIHRFLCLRTTIIRSGGHKKYEVTGMICLFIVLCSLNSPVLYGNVLVHERQTSAQFPREKFTNISQTNEFSADNQNMSHQTHKNPLIISKAKQFGDAEENLKDHTAEHSENDSQTLEYNCVYISKEFEAFMLEIWIPFCVTIYFFLPVTIIVICNIGIVFTIIKSRRTVANFQNTHLNHAKHSGTIILVVISVYTLLTTIPLSVYGLIMSNYKNSYIQPETYIVQIAVFFLGYSNFALNGALCLWFGSKFRRELLAILTELKTTMVAFHRRNRVNPE